jgi:hypothetical protein
VSKSVWVEARELKFLEFAKEFSWKILKFSSKIVKNMSKSVWVQTRELKFRMNMLCLFKYEISYSNLEFFEIRLKGFLKSLDIFLKKCQKCVKELIFWMNELFNNVFKAFFFLNFEKFTLDLSEKNCCFAIWGKFTRAPS